MTSQFTCISGYDQDVSCEHCNRKLAHGVKTSSHGVVGADCFVKLIKANRDRFSGNGKPTASMVRDYAKMVERRSAEALARVGYHSRHFEFELA